MPFPKPTPAPVDVTVNTSELYAAVPATLAGPISPSDQPAGRELRLKVTPFEAKPLTVTSTGPVVAPVGTGATILVALQLDGVEVTPLKVTVLEP